MNSYLWLIALCITHAALYCMGKRDGLERQPNEDAWIVVEKYEIDKKYEHKRWLEERKMHHDAG